MRIGELAKLSGVKAETIRFYEKEGVFGPPPRTAGNYRTYDQAHLARLTLIRQLREVGFELAELPELLDLLGENSPGSASTRAPNRQEIREKLVEKFAILRRVEAALKAHLS